MELHRISGKAAAESAKQNTPPEISSSNAPPKTESSSAVLPQFSKTPSPSALAAAAGLPSDRLSSAIISFARFFSLPFKPELLASLRRQALASDLAKAAPAENTEISANIRETLSLATAAAAGKGVEFSHGGLEAYAAAINPDCRGGSDNSHERRKKRDNREKDEIGKPISPTNASDLRNAILKNAEEDPLLAILNKLPDKDRKRWIAFPFDFCEGSRMFRVSLRLLLDEKNHAHPMVHSFALDIAETGESKRRWLFAINTQKTADSCQNPGIIGDLTVYLQPEPADTSAKVFIRQLSALLGIPEKCVFLQKHAESFPAETQYGNSLLRPVNESV